MIDKLAFYQEATVRVTSSLNPDKSLPRLYKCIQSVMPLDAMVYLAYDFKEGAVHIRSMRTNKITQQPNEKFWVTDKVKRFYDWPIQKDVMLLNRVKEEQLGRQVLSYISKKLVDGLGSAILLRMRHGEKTIAFSGFFALGNGAYTQEHADLINMLGPVQSMVARNAMRYYDEVRQKRALAEENRFLYQELKRISGEEIIGADSGLKHIMEAVSKLSRVNTPVLILGETGVGKELIADAIQQASERKNAPYVKVNCGAIPDSLLDSELFGHEKGAFTGAIKTQKGRLERAHRGTIFLDELGELPLAAQVRLLRVVQNHELEKVGGQSTVPVDIRIIAASNRDLTAMVKAGTFREDLYFRLNVFPITVPPLRQRLEDVPKLLDHFVKKLSLRMKLPGVPEIDQTERELFLQYGWPGNVRELENLVERAIIIKPDGPLEFSGLLPLGVDEHEPMDDPEIKPLDEVISRHILRALLHSGGKISGPRGAARLLGIHPNTLRNRMDKLGINYKR